MVAVKHASQDLVDERCTDRCMDKQCSLCQFDASKCYECFTGWYGKHCDEKCPKHCSTADCDQGTGKCQKCKNGYFGEFCNGKCDVACDTCSDNVSCDTCKKSLYGVFCNLVCPKECIDCARDGKCETCSAGYFGADCMCSIAECTNATNNKCFRCRNNMTWYSFQNGCCPCSEHCLRSITTNRRNFNTGNCMHGCKNNYIGEKMHR
ncbi:unnamed protein product [Mytilus coruscus]|uniref:MEGF10_11 n=1 Tax=Mytilus coruscus TaxID=42192 RepID=A0A6J8B8N3_MYTCO|nr:unnamed protein product [Mytilus coruscus]